MLSVNVALSRGNGLSGDGVGLADRALAGALEQDLGCVPSDSDRRRACLLRGGSRSLSRPRSSRFLRPKPTASGAGHKSAW